MGESLRQLSDRRSLKGWVVLTRDEMFALNYGPTIVGRGWGFDWLSRATVFKDKTAACRALKHIGEEETRRTARVVSVASVATMQPHINQRGRLVWYAGDARSPMKGKDYAILWQGNAKELTEKANKMLKQAGALSRHAKKITDKSLWK